MGLFQKYGLEEDKIFADDNGLGQPIIDGLARHKYNVNRVLNQSAAIHTMRYLNRGAELWFIFARLLQTVGIPLPKDLDKVKLKRQLTTRHFGQDPRLGKLKLWAKAEERAKGNDSPDWADALVLAFTGTTIFDFTESTEAKLHQKALQSKIVTTADILRYNTKKYRDWQREGTDKPKKSNGFNNSNPISVLRTLY